MNLFIVNLCNFFNELVGGALLSCHIFFPIICAFISLALSRYQRIQRSRSLKVVVLLASLLNLFLSMLIAWQFDYEKGSFQFVEKQMWIMDYNLSYNLGIDVLSLYLIMLSNLLTTLCIFSSLRSVKNKTVEFVSLILMLQGLIIGVFASVDIILFYVFFESVLIPMFFIIGIWGGKNKVYAAFKFFLYTFLGSLCFLIAAAYMVISAGTGDIIELQSQVPFYDLEMQCWLWGALFVAFAIKIPMVPFHTWLPDAHVQAPTAGSVLLAGVLLKIGGYGFLRFSLPILPGASIYFADFMIILSIIAVIYASIVALMQTDIKKMIAYSSIAHMGYVTAGIFALNQQGIDGAIFTMVSHGLISGALFFCIGILYERVQTKEISAYSGVAVKMPLLAMLFMVFTMASIALPLTSGFVGEFLVLCGIFKINKLYGFLLSLGMILGASYMLWLYARVMFYSLKPNLSKIRDLYFYEKIVLTPIAVLIVLLGIMPNFITKNLYIISKNFEDHIEIMKNNAPDKMYYKIRGGNN